MNTALYRLDTAGIQHDFVHLYEHLILHGFYHHAEAQGYHPGLIGWLNGDTFEECVYIDTGFYHPAVMELFEAYMADLPHYDDAAIEQALGIISAEERSGMTPVSLAVFEQAMREIRSRTWSQGEKTAAKHIEDKPVVPVLSKHHQPATYRDITFDWFCEDLTETEGKVLQRFSVILCDMLQVSLQANYPAYARGYSMLHGYGTSGMYISGIFTVPRGRATVTQYRQTVLATLTTLDLDTYYPLLRQHFDTYAEEPWLRALPIEFYRNSGTITTNAEVARLATQEVLQSLLNKIDLHVHATNAVDRKQVK